MLEFFGGFLGKTTGMERLFVLQTGQKRCHLEYFIRKRQQNANYFLLVDTSFHKDLQPKPRLQCYSDLFCDHRASIFNLDDTHNAQVSNAKFRGQLGVATGQEQVRVLPLGCTSNSPEAVHSHLKDQSQWSYQAHLFLPPLLRVGPSVQFRDGPLFFWRGGGGE